MLLLGCRSATHYAQVKRSQPWFNRANLSTRTGNVRCGNYGTSVSSKVFADYVRKCGVTKKRLHQQLYPRDQGQCAPKGKFPIAVAVSGGADSMALMLLLREYLQENQIKTPLLAVTVDHQLRIESSREALEVARICAKHGGITHVTKACDWHSEDTGQQAGEGHQSDLLTPVKPRDSKMEEQAREYRYNLLRQVCLKYRVQCLFVAHNRGDQLETTLFRLGRASGINGLAGIANQLPLCSLDGLPHRSTYSGELETNSMVTLVRPLLSVTKDELMATCDRFQQPWIHDPSNDDLKYDRVRIRQELKRVEREQGSEILDLFARFQMTAEKAKKEFARVERAMLRKYIVTWESDLVVLRTAVLHDPNMFEELLYRLLSIVIVHTGNKDTPPRLASIARLVRDLQRLETGKQITLGGCRIKRIAKGRQLEIQPERKR
ncbi:tRNA(Ile)-lysidine synthetase [Phytophthora nicotianae CJ01A1]|uniref:tRNA(Ile)-lysidine synthetase n=2 Tax=Phytophthora nicotianae TaxID=4792 RepID=W2WEM3_PHYNI|nr:tRNA(Ile)-lysidine synthetase [Phytophthora nicotianae]ETP08807.1 tRNA(Ile)-lysidine synthetase [Phytophthora nicotianae CJ01A1]